MMTEAEFNALQKADQEKGKRFDRIVIAVIVAIVAAISVWWLAPWELIKNQDITSFQDSNIFWMSGTIGFGILTAILFFINDDPQKGIKAVASTRLYERIGIFFIFHLMIWFVLWAWAHYFIYPALGGEGFFKSLCDMIGIIFITASMWNSFDTETIKQNFRGEILYFNYSFASNVEPGFVCLGLPKWCGSTIPTVDFKTLTIIIGLIKNGAREPFIVECAGFRAIFDVMFEAAPNDTKRILKLEGGAAKIESRLVAFVNGTINALVNKVDSTGQPVYDSINKLKGSIFELQEDVFSNKVLQDEFKDIGYILHKLVLKDIENEDRQIIDAANALKAKPLLEELERLNITNTGVKARMLWDLMHGVGTPHESTAEEKKKFTMLDAMKAVQAAEGVRTITQFEGNVRPLVFSGSSGTP
jgi:hypothetical protein